MYDYNAQLQANVTKTATFTGATFDLKTGTPKRGIPLRLLVGTVSGTSPTLDVKVQESSDDTTYNDLLVFDRVTASNKEQFETLVTSKRYVRAVATIGGTLPSFPYQVDLGNSSP